MNTTPPPSDSETSPSDTCTCAEPVPQERGERKGVGRSFCARCGLPLRLELGSDS